MSTGAYTTCCGQATAGPTGVYHRGITRKLDVQERLKALRKTHGSKELGKVTVDMTIGGMRGITVSSPSLLGELQCCRASLLRGTERHSSAWHFTACVGNGTSLPCQCCMDGRIRLQPGT